MMFQRVRAETEKAYLLPERTHSQIGFRAVVSNLSSFTDWQVGGEKLFLVSGRHSHTREAPLVPSAYVNEAAQVCVPVTYMAQIQTGCGLRIGDP